MQRSHTDSLFTVSSCDVCLKTSRIRTVVGVLRCLTINCETPVTKPLDYNLILDAHNMFKEHGVLVPILKRFCFDKDTERSFKTSGLYVFYQQERTKICGASSMLYVGRTQCLSKRFKEHKNNWIKKYIAKYPQFDLWWGCISSQNGSYIKLFDNMMHIGMVENYCWQRSEELGLKRLNKIYELVT